MSTTGLRIVTFNVLPPAYQLVVQWAGQFQHTILLVVTTPGPSTRRTPSYRGVLDSAPIGQDVLVIFDQNDVDLAHRPESIGAYVTTSLFGFGYADVSARFINNNDIANAARGILADKVGDYQMSLVVTDSTGSIHGNGIGIEHGSGAIDSLAVDAFILPDHEKATSIGCHSG